MTETERDDVLKKRKGDISSANILPEQIPDSVLCGTRNFEITLEVEAMMASILAALNTDSSMETLLGVLCQILEGISILNYY